MKIAIRLDDITPDMNWSNFERFKSLLDKYNIKALLGIVPENRDPKLMINLPKRDFWEYIKDLEKDGWTLAMHGYHHEYTTHDGGLLPLNRNSEFAGLPFDKQDRMIRSGKILLEKNGITTDIFMAPSHSYDMNTIKALKKNGFTGITDGFGNAPYMWEDMVFYPISFKKSQTLKSKEDGCVTFVVHTNTMTDRDFEAYEKLLATREIVSYSEMLKLKPVKTTETDRFKEKLMATTKFHLRETLRISSNIKRYIKKRVLKNH